MGDFISFKIKFSAFKKEEEKVSLFILYSFHPTPTPPQQKQQKYKHFTNV